MKAYYREGRQSRAAEERVVAVVRKINLSPFESISILKSKNETKLQCRASVAKIRVFLIGRMSLVAGEIIGVAFPA